MRLRISVNGRVQGVGFRPTVYRYAEELKLSGWVKNSSCGVIIEIEGEKAGIDDFIRKLETCPPPNAQINQISTFILPSRSEISENSSRIWRVEQFVGEDGFKIIQSVEDTRTETEVSPDIATCSECLSELLNSHDRRFLYPFINCINCGPRFTIVKSIPYDRERTTMDKFTMCSECSREYHSSASRRFHTQPNACHDCGPQIELVRSSVPGVQSKGIDAIKDTIRLLKEGRIVAIKGLGGFHLACDAENDTAVRNLRSRKNRENKPFALMAKNLEVVKQFCEVSDEEEQLLLSPKRPIVLLKKRVDKPAPSGFYPRGLKPEGSGDLSHSKMWKAFPYADMGMDELARPDKAVSEGVAPNNKYLGFMLPYTPLHHLLFHAPVNLSHSLMPDTTSLPASKENLSVLVMTSGNFSDEPIIHRNDDAFIKLKESADFLLVHNRDIFIQCDDSVTRVFPLSKDEIIIRRARGYVPEPVRLRGFDLPEGIAVLATGADLKNTFCLANGNQFIISQHIGDMENFETFQSFENSIEHFKKLFKITPTVIACDLHTEYLTAKYAKKLSGLNPQISDIGIQHHHAHIASCMADNDMENRKVIGVAFDGTGYGSDGTIWGAEFLVSDYTEFERAAHLKYIRLPGGDAAVKEPWRIAVSLLYEAYGENFGELDLDFTKRLNKEKWLVLKRMLDKGINCPSASSMGRLFDGISALLGFPATPSQNREITYEGEAAILMEMAIEPVQTSEVNVQPTTLLRGASATKQSIEKRRDCFAHARNDTNFIEKTGNTYILNFIPIVKGIVEDLQAALPVSVISEKFHNTIAEMTVETCVKIRSDSHNELNEVALSGGVFQNMFLLNKIYNDLIKDGFKVYVHRRVPPNDGGISLGQAVIAGNKIKN